MKARLDWAHTVNTHETTQQTRKERLFFLTPPDELEIATKKKGRVTWR